MRSNLILATIMVASATFALPAHAGEYEKCLARCAMMDLSSQPSCERSCETLLAKPPATATPTTTATATTTTVGKKPPKPATTSTGAKQPDPPPSDKECNGENEAELKACVCESGFERFPAETGPCVPVCAAGEMRDANGVCGKCEAKFDCRACIEQVKTELSLAKTDYDNRLALLSAQAERNFYMLLAALLLLLGLLGWRAKDQVQQPKKPTTKK